LGFDLNPTYGNELRRVALPPTETPIIPRVSLGRIEFFQVPMRISSGELDSLRWAAPPPTANPMITWG
jgi:hypothetical protein